MPSILRVNVIAAKDLTAKDWTTSDPFVIIKLGGQSHKTSVIFRNLSPVWNFSCDFIITPALVDARIQLECWDKDLIGRDFLGRLSIPAYEAVFNAFDDPRNTPSWHMLSARSPKEKISGELKLKFGYVGDLGHDIKQLEAFAANLRKQHLQATLVSSEDPADELYSPSEAISSLSGRSPINANTNLSLESIDIENSVDSISNITNLVEGSSLDHTALRGMLSLEIQSGCIAASFDNSNVDPFVVITFGQKTFKTRILRKTVNPVWNERAVIHVKHVDLETNHPISLEIVDYKSQNIPIGSVQLNITDLIQKCPPPILIENAPASVDLLSLNLRLTKNVKSAAANPASLSIRVGFFPYSVLRRNFFLSLLRFFDANDDGKVNQVELTTMLDSIGSTLSDDSIRTLFLDEETLNVLSEIKLEVAANALENRLTEGRKNSANSPATPCYQMFRRHYQDEQIIDITHCPICCKKIKQKKDIDVVSHAALCAHDNANKIHNFFFGGFSTDLFFSQSWFTKTLSVVAYQDSRYGLGRNKGVIYVQDRTSKQIYEEQLPVYVRIGVRLLFCAAGANSGNDVESIKMLLRSLTMKQGAKYTDPSSREEIGRFIAFHNIVMDEIQQPLSAFANFNEFFYRKLKPGTRVPESKDANVILSPVDSRMCCYPTLSDVTRFWVKGTKFDLPRLLSDEKMASLFSNGALSIFRLAPQDYHRFHSPVNGVIKSIKRVSGEFFTVANVAVQSAVDVYTENERVVFLIDTPKTGSGPGSFGIVALICVGSLLVGSINATVKVGQNVKRMDELGYFAFGGSTVILVFAEDTMTFDHDLIDYSSQCLESVVKVGNQIGISLR